MMEHVNVNDLGDQQYLYELVRQLREAPRHDAERGLSHARMTEADIIIVADALEQIAGRIVALPPAGSQARRDMVEQSQRDAARQPAPARVPETEERQPTAAQQAAQARERQAQAEAQQARQERQQRAQAEDEERRRR